MILLSMDSMEIKNLSLEGLKLISPKRFEDARGFFTEAYRKSWDEALGASFVQDNHSFSKRGVIRGMHYQPGQAKLVRVASGKILDVAVDIRPASKTFGKWEGVYLDGERQLFIPDGFAHGFCVIEDAHVLYKVSSFYDAKTECGFHYDSVGIEWPITEPLVSKRDLDAPKFEEALL